jgi:hypothetical protein
MPNGLHPAVAYDSEGYPEIEDLKRLRLGRVFKAIGDGNCIPFFGAGASMDYAFNGSSAPGVPNAWEMTLEFLGEAGIASKAQIIVLKDLESADPTALKKVIHLLNFDLLKAAEAFLFLKSNNRGELDAFLRRRIELANGPRPIHTVIAQIQDIYTALTTNYDRLFENACTSCQRDLFLHVHEQLRQDSGNWRCKANLKKPEIIYHKMHGCVDRAGSMVITRGDYIRYLANWTNPAKGMPSSISSRLPSSILLFLGYSLRDWNFLAIWEGVVASYPQGGDEIQSFAVMKSVSDEDRAFLQKKNIEAIECDLTLFAIALAKEFKLKIPQLGLPRAGANNGGPI